jgi:DNA-binding transcriptional LysR family regulator
VDRFRCLQVFSAVARRASFSHAARELKISNGSVTKYVACLEASMGVVLLNRSPKQVCLTVAGVCVLEAAAELLDRYDQMQSDARGLVHQPRGPIRIGAPPAFAAHQLTRVITQFNSRYPDIEVTIVVDKGNSDLIERGLDISIRITTLLDDSSYISAPLGKAPQILVASPAYFRSRLRPQNIEELAEHDCLIHTTKSASMLWRFEGNPPKEVRVSGRLHSDLGEVVMQAALLGAGIALHPTYMVELAVASGELEVVLPHETPECLDITAIYLTRRYMPVRVRHLLEFIKQWGREPGWNTLALASNAVRHEHQMTALKRNSLI